MAKSEIEGGAFIIARQIFESAIWKNNPHIIKLFIYLIGEARHKRHPKKYPHFNIERGELLTSLKKLAEENQYEENGTLKEWSRAKVSRMLQSLVEQQYIEIKPNTYGTQIKVCNYDKYQDLSNYKADTPETPRADSNETPKADSNETPIKVCNYESNQDLLNYRADSNETPRAEGGETEVKQPYRGGCSKNEKNEKNKKEECVLHPLTAQIRSNIPNRFTVDRTKLSNAIYQWEKSYPHVDLLLAASRCSTWLVDSPKGRQRKDWIRTFGNWLRNGYDLPLRNETDKPSSIYREL